MTVRIYGALLTPLQLEQSSMSPYALYSNV